MKKILVTGSVAYDLLLTSDGSFADAFTKADLSSLSTIFLAHHYRRHHGGTAANIAWNLNLLGASPLTVATVGDDGYEYLALLQERGVDTKYIEQLDEYATSTAIIGTDSHENQVGFFHPGADQHGTWPDLNQERDDLAYAIVSPRDAGNMLAALDWCKQQGVPVFFDPGQQIHNFSDDDLARAAKGCEGIIVNEYEWSVLQEKLKCTEENCALFSPHLIVTRGEAGITIFGPSGAEVVAACTASAVLNPTGAGDAFRAGFLAGLAVGWPQRDAARLGAAMGSFAVEIEGTLVDHIDRDTVWARAEETYGEKLPQLAGDK